MDLTLDYSQSYAYCGHVAYTRVLLSISKLYDLALAKQWRYSTAGKITIDLAMHNTTVWADWLRRAKSILFPVYTA